MSAQTFRKGKIEKYINDTVVPRIEGYANNESLHKKEENVEIARYYAGRKLECLKVVEDLNLLFLKDDLDENNIYPFSPIGFSQKNSKKFLDLLSSRSGIILIAGQTGSGKTETAYATLEKLASEGKMVLSFDTLKERDVKGVIKVVVKARDYKETVEQYKFSVNWEYLEPDAIFIGEIRDWETFQLANELAEMDYLVISTIHARNAYSALARILHFNPDRKKYGLNVKEAKYIKGIIGQKLLKKVCEDCKTECSSILEKEHMELLAVGESLKFSRGIGPVYRSLIKEGYLKDVLEIAKKDGFEDMLMDASEKVSQGLITPEEIHLKI